MPRHPHLIVLAGGASSRMWPLREKSLIRFGTEPLLVAQLRRYQALGFTDAVIVANPENYSDITPLAARLAPMRVTVVIQPEPKGMGDAILRAAPQIAPRQPIYITQVHDVVDDMLHLDLLRAHQAEPGASHIAGVEMAEYFPGGYLVLGGSGRLLDIVEKPGADRRPSNLVNIVAHIHADSSVLFNTIEAEYKSSIVSDDHYERAMARLMRDLVYRVVPYRGPWKALKYPWHVLEVMEYYLSRIQGQIIAESAFIAPTASIRGDVYIGDRVKVFPGAAIVGPAFIGADTVVGNNALVRGSMVLNHCEVGYTTEVARSYVADHVSMHACRVLDSVFASGVNFSAGCTTANLRIDRRIVNSMVKGQKVASGRDKLGAIIGKDAFLAVDVMTMPGVKIGEGAQIGPGTHVHDDVRNRARVYVKQEIVIVDGDADGRD